MEMGIYLAIGEAADELRIRGGEMEKMEPWLAEEVLRKYLENGKESGFLVEELEFVYRDVRVSWRLTSGRNFPLGYCCNFHTTWSIY